MNQVYGLSKEAWRWPMTRSRLTVQIGSLQLVSSCNLCCTLVTPLPFLVPSVWNNLPHSVHLGNSSSFVQLEPGLGVWGLFAGMLTNSPLRPDAELPMGVSCVNPLATQFAPFPVASSVASMTTSLTVQCLQWGPVPCLWLSQKLKQVFSAQFKIIEW